MIISVLYKIEEAEPKDTDLLPEKSIIALNRPNKVKLVEVQRTVMRDNWPENMPTSGDWYMV